MAAADQTRRVPYLALAIVLHVAVLLALMMAPRPSPMPSGQATPVTIVSEGPPEAPAEAESAPIPREAQAPEPQPQAPPPKPTPAPQSVRKPTLAPSKKPSPPKPDPKPTPAPKPTPLPKPAPTPKPTPVAKSTPTRKDLDLDALQASLASSTHASPRASAAARGPQRAAASPVLGAARTVSAADQAGLKDLLNRLWNPNCSVAGADSVEVKVNFTVGEDGRLVGRPNAGGKERSPDPVVFAAARRAIDAVHRVEPYQPAYRGHDFGITFDAKKACEGR